MSTDRNRFTVSVDDAMYDAIEEFRHKHKITTRSKAIERLLELGISKLLCQATEGESKKNTAPTAKDAEEAMITLLRYMLEREPSDDEKELFSRTVPILLNGIKDGH